MPSSSSLRRVVFVACAILSSYAFAENAAGRRLPLLLDATLDELRAGLDNGDFTSVDLVDAYLRRIGEVNPTLHAVNEVNSEARHVAAKRDEERRTRTGPCEHRCPPLHGIPILLKDSIATNDTMRTTAGSFALFDAKVAEDSTVVAKLRQAGAVLLGKTNLSQWCGLRSANALYGWSSVGGQTVGAYSQGQNPCGSSSGSAVAASIGLAFAALGTQTFGSIIMPASRNNIVGIKPTLGLTSRYNVLMGSERRDGIGPMARTVRDAAHVLSAIAGPDDKDQYTSAFPLPQVPNYADACDGTALRGKRIGVLRPAFRSAEFAGPFDAALQTMKDAGAELVNVTKLAAGVLESRVYLGYNEVAIMSDFSSNLQEYLARLVSNPHNITSLEDLNAFTQADSRENVTDSAYWDDALSEGWSKTHPEVIEIVKNITDVARQGLLDAFKGPKNRGKLDALVTDSDGSYQVADMAGWPVMTVPLACTSMAFANEPDSETGTMNMTGPNMPFGISFVGEPWSEESLIGMAYAFEQRTKAREKVKPWASSTPKTELEHVVGKPANVTRS
ncbi:hypothetical protein RJ55_06373 [Drechmeria coniospora]|nr:hypothetical protein RJ55_06373 [Drechmeria coniospora]